MKVAKELGVWWREWVKQLSTMCRLSVGSQVRVSSDKEWETDTDLSRRELRKSLPFIMVVL